MRSLPIAWFVSSHGFGHAARSCAVMEAAFAQDPGVEFHVFSSVPPWFFRDSLSAPYTLHPEEVDPGLVQRTAVEEDLAASLLLARETLDQARVRAPDLAEMLSSLGCRGAVADISPLGVEAGRSAGIPTVMLDNFTWDQAFRGFAERDPMAGSEWTELGHMFGELGAAVDLRIRAEPSVPLARDGSRSGAPVVSVPPIARPARTDRHLTRRAIGVPEDIPLILITLGGVGGAVPRLEQLERYRGLFFVVPGMPEWGFGPNSLLLPTRSGYYHPDLVAAADAVAGKLGYSTLAECHLSNTPYAYFPRPGFVEAPFLAAWLEDRGLGAPLPAESLQDGGWMDEIPSVLEAGPPSIGQDPVSGAGEAARLILELARAPSPP
jgi:hypothetical protein